jgi:hypothetical protein
VLPAVIWNYSNAWNHWNYSNAWNHWKNIPV